MRSTVVVAALGLVLSADVSSGQASAQTQTTDRMNRMIPLIQQGLPVLGVNNPVYARGRGGGGRGGRGGAAADTTTPPPIVMADVARETVAYTLGDFVLNSFSPNTVEQYREYMKAIVAAGGSARTHPFAAKIPIIHGNEAASIQRLIDQLNEGQVKVEMQEVETVEEVNQVISAMRFVSKGGTRPESGFERAAAYWGMTPAQYLQKADVWPLNPNGELLIGVIIESKPGIANARAIAAMPGVAVVIAGAGTLGGVFSSQDSTGRRVRDQAGFDAGVAAILAACKEYKKACGYPANNPAEVETLMKAGWNFLIMQRRDSAAFNAVLTGHRLSGRK
ncbi:MAG TPA: aldolase/citrate lyase family protein [Gemmatimonadaceae bacterium]|nr:aldolase/citrate lyase family protein [Gemmatimonadaceae bacterium]